MFDKDAIMDDLINKIKNKDPYVANTIREPFSEGVNYISMCRKCIKFDGDRDHVLDGVELVEPINISIGDLNNRIFSSIDREQVKGQCDLARQEDDLFVSLLGKYKRPIDDVFNLKTAVGTVLMRPVTYRNLKAKLDELEATKEYDPVRQYSVLKTGCVGFFNDLNMVVRISKSVNNDHCYILPKPEVLGTMYATKLIIVPGKDVTYEAKEIVKFEIN